MKEKHINFYGIYLSQLVQPRFDFLARRIKIDVEDWGEDPRIGEKVTAYLASEAAWENVYVSESTIIYTQGMEDAITDMRNNLCAVRDTFKSVRRTTKDSAALLKIDKSYLTVRDFVENVTTNRPDIVARADNFVKMAAKMPKDTLALLNISAYTANIKAAQVKYNAEIKDRKAIVNANKGKCTAQWKVLLKDMKDLLTLIDVWGNNEAYHSLIGSISQSFKQLIKKFGDSKPKPGDGDKADPKSSK